MSLAFVVDDSKATRKILTRALNDMGFAVEEASDGHEGFKQLERMPSAPQVILTDWNMPVMDGLELVRLIRKQARFKQSVIVMVTTQTEMDRIVEALDAGANEYVMKPFTKEILEDKLRLLKLVQ